jgi:hypothetical protein
MNAEPTKLLLRRTDVIEWTGISREEFKKLLASGTLRGSPLRPGGRNFYLREHVRQVLIDPFRPEKHA